jgi:hypothetical protein
VLAPRNDDSVSVQVYFQLDPSLSSGAFAAATADFLAGRNDSVGNPQPIPGGGSNGFEIDANGAGGSETARGVLSGDYRYLVIRTIGAGAPAGLRQQAADVVASFRPR